MTKQRVFVTRKLPDEVLLPLRELFDCRLYPEADRPVPRERLLEEVATADGVLSMLTEVIDAQLLASAPSLKVVSNMAVGYDNIDLQAARARGVIVCNTPDVLTETTADLTFALLLAAARKVVESADFIRQGAWHSWAPFLLAGQDVHHKTLGLVGLGRIGSAVARRAQGFGMRILYTSRQRHEEAEATLSAVYTTLPELLAESDFVCILTPYTPQTHHLIGERELQWMKPSAVLVNTARGSVVDEQALYQALRDRAIWGAGLDVFEREPVSADNPLLSLPNVVALPHIGSATVDTRMAMARQAADNLTEALLGRSPRYRVV
ncbi:2-hydroxyacid dehydrogenase [Alicyclobacillus sp. ALC3]|uniref:2-hydroxyacid dehydrogenase n=1 Tax=Alicyclobacillus sp. ALC3 TaxID=2796143 RepID=UPI00237885A5|nr:D-glycerate dehydrogenase [Alicyclobacillus sp. ALC3]WDL98078.1 D-glycerate dehydrogenase [Alicyclobacillus sp. ALC3]